MTIETDVVVETPGFWKGVSFEELFFTLIDLHLDTAQWQTLTQVYGRMHCL